MQAMIYNCGDVSDANDLMNTGNARDAGNDLQ
jgi:hypothetical protein